MDSGPPYLLRCAGFSLQDYLGIVYWLKISVVSVINICMGKNSSCSSSHVKIHCVFVYMQRYSYLPLYVRLSVIYTSFRISCNTFLLWKFLEGAILLHLVIGFLYLPSISFPLFISFYLSALHMHALCLFHVATVGWRYI